MARAHTGSDRPPGRMALITSFARTASTTGPLKIGSLEEKREKSTGKCLNYPCYILSFVLLRDYASGSPLYYPSPSEKSGNTAARRRPLEIPGAGRGALFVKSPTWRLRQPKGLRLPGLHSSAVTRTYLSRLRASFVERPAPPPGNHPKQAPEISPLYCHSLCWPPHFLVDG